MEDHGVGDQSPLQPIAAPAAVAAGLSRIAAARDEFVSVYERDGFTIVKGVFSLEEVLAMRKACAEVFAETGGKIGELATYPQLRRVLLDDRVIAIARAALGKAVVYFGDSNFYANSRFDRHIHNDARGDAEDPSTSDYPILRMGIYLQDHAFHSNGLKVRPRSHKSVFWNVRNGLRLVGIGGKRLSPGAFRPRWFYNVPTEPGDLVFWNLRTHHAGHALRLRGLDGFALPPAVEGLVPARMARPMAKERYAIFMSWGRESAALSAYVKSLAYLPGYQGVWQRSSFDAQVVRDAFATKGVTLNTDALLLSKLGV